MNINQISTNRIRVRFDWNDRATTFDVIAHRGWNHGQRALPRVINLRVFLENRGTGNGRNEKSIHARYSFSFLPFSPSGQSRPWGRSSGRGENCRFWPQSFTFDVSFVAKPRRLCWPYVLSEAFRLQLHNTWSIYSNAVLVYLISTRLISYVIEV